MIAVIAMTVLVSADSSSADPRPLPPCGACDGKYPDGWFKGEGTQKTGVLVTKWTSYWHFNSTSKTVLIISDPESDPLHLQPRVHCPGVPIIYDESRCNMTFADECIQKESYDSRGITLVSDTTVWDGKDKISKDILVIAPIIGKQRTQFTGHRIPTPDPPPEGLIDVSKYLV